MATFRARTSFDKVFKVGIVLKGLDGLVETLAGVFFLLIRPEKVSSLVENLVAPELSQDPHDLIANHLLHWAQSFTEAAAIFAGIYLLAHGLVKLVLVVAILRERLWAYPLLIIVTAIFVIYQFYHIAEKATFGYIFLTVFDLVIIYLTVKEYGRQKQRLRRKQADSPS